MIVSTPIYSVGMDVLMGEVLDLQRVWSSTNTDAMKRRGVIVRDELAAWLDARSVALGEHGCGGGRLRDSG